MKSTLELRIWAWRLRFGGKGLLSPSLGLGTSGGGFSVHGLGDGAYSRGIKA